jgi:EpsI family protein
MPIPNRYAMSLQTELSSYRAPVHEGPRRKRGVFAAAALAAAFFFAYAGVIMTLGEQWLAADARMHGFLIPIISLYLVWTRRRKLQKIPPCPASVMGFALLIAGLAMLLVGQAGTILLLQELSLPVTIAGIIALMLGAKFLAAVLLPVFYLIFMIPVWEVLTAPLMPYYQKISSVMGSLVMLAAGIPVHRDGIFIELPHITLEVAEACSGLNSLFAVTALGVALCYLFIESWTRRIALIGIGIVIATLFNGFRIGLIGVMSYHGMSSALHGPGHMLQGLSVSASGFLALFAGVRLLAEGNAGQADKGKDPIGRETPACGPRCSDRGLYGLAGALAALVVAGVFPVITAAVPMPPRQELDLIPKRIDRWEGRDAAPFSAVLTEMEFDHRLARQYRSSEGTIDVFVGYLEEQGAAREIADFRIAGLHKSAARMSVMPEPGARIEINAVTTPDRGESRKVLFWYQIGERVIADRYRAALETAMNRIFNKRTNGALVMISYPANEDGADRTDANVEFVPLFMAELRNGL